MVIQVLVDNPGSWLIPYAEKLVEKLKELEHESRLITHHNQVVSGDVLCLLGCERIFKKLDLNRHNLVVHESDLPEGKGWSPLTWQILEGKNRIPVTLFEAVEQLDAGTIYGQKIIELTGTELLPEIKHKQGLATLDLILDFVEKFPNNKGKDQEGESSFYPKRTPKDSELDPFKTIADQFELMRVCDNERYPAYFNFRNKKYTIKIFEND